MKEVEEFYGQWKVIKLYPTHHFKPKARHCKAICLGCKKEFIRIYSSIKRGYTMGCNTCSKKRRYANYRPYSGSRLHRIWLNMNNRCNNANGVDYKWYGAKGVRVCAHWRTYLNFKAWAIENGYKDLNVEFKYQLSIDRIDPAGNYEPSNCQWLTVSENSIKAYAQTSTTIPKGSTAKWLEAVCATTK